MYVHGVAGAVLVVIAFFGSGEALGQLSVDRLRYASPVSAGVGGLMVLAYVGVHHLTHGRAEGESTDAAHWAVGISLVVAAIIVGLGRQRAPWAPLAEFAGPFANILIGALFLVHGGTERLPELILHVSIAASLVLSALVHFAVILGGDGGRALRLFGVLLLMIGGLLLVLYDAYPSPSDKAGALQHQEH